MRMWHALGGVVRVGVAQDVVDDENLDRFAVRAPIAIATSLLLVGCGAESQPGVESAPAAAAESADYCSVPDLNAEVLLARPSDGAEPIDDVNWFARPVPHDGDQWIIAFASHDQNYIYDLTNDRRVRIPDRSDAVATPDGRYMTVPSTYTPDSNIRFYPIEPMLEALERGEDADGLEPAFIHDHPAMSRVYYQSTAVVAEREADGRTETTYRLMFSGTGGDSAFRIADYLFAHNAD
ncbi:MAG: hypothetical protein R3344_15000, partial [Acidobacteriota bacterium]|nr:hypothetical protein [Acidobacteriota bacterium]